MTKESKSVNEISPEQINQWIKEHQDNINPHAQDKLVKHYRKLIESLLLVRLKDIYEIRHGAFMFLEELKKLVQE